jgi:hypothetical protein
VTVSRYTLKVILVFLSIGIFSSPTHADSRIPHFQPERGIFGSYGLILDYHTTVRKVLLPTGSPTTEFGAVVLPSFTSEWTLIIHPPVDNHATVEVRIVDGQVWAATQMDDPVPGFTTHKQELDANVALAAVAALRHALGLARAPESSTGGGVDGTNYHFFSHGSPFLAGHTWSPAAGTLTGKTVQLLEKLRKFTESPPENEPANEAELHTAAKAILNPE